MPMSSIVNRSASRICAAVRIRIAKRPLNGAKLREVYHSGYGRNRMAATVNVNGTITSDRDAVVSVFDHGFIYGEGVYETLRTYGGRMFLYDRHMRRLRNSARLIDLEIPFSDDELAEQIHATIAATKLDGCEAYVR